MIAKVADYTLDGIEMIERTAPDLHHYLEDKPHSLRDDNPLHEINNRGGQAFFNFTGRKIHTEIDEEEHIIQCYKRIDGKFIAYSKVIEYSDKYAFFITVYDDYKQMLLTETS